MSVKMTTLRKWSTVQLTSYYERVYGVHPPCTDRAFILITLLGRAERMVALDRGLPPDPCPVFPELEAARAIDRSLRIHEQVSGDKGLAFGRKLTPLQVEQVRQLKRDGASLRQLAAIFGVSKKTIENVVNGDHYQADAPVSEKLKITDLIFIPAREYDPDDLLSIWFDSSDDQFQSWFTPPEVAVA